MSATAAAGPAGSADVRKIVVRPSRVKAARMLIDQEKRGFGKTSAAVQALADADRPKKR